MRKFGLTYEGLAGTVSFFSDVVRLNTHNLTDYKWEHDNSPLLDGMGVRHERFKKGAQTQKIVAYMAASPEWNVFSMWLGQIARIFEADIRAGVQGRMMPTDYPHDYLLCNIVGFEVSQWDKDSLFVCLTLTVYIPKPFWTTESFYALRPATPIEVAGQKRYPHKYPYRYVTSSANNFVRNLDYAAAQMKIIMYGPVADPSFTLAGCFYGMHITLEAGDRVVIDQRAKTIELYYANGHVENVFSKRNKSTSVFAPLTRGHHLALLHKNFNVDILVYLERSTPRWGEYPSNV